MYSSRPIHPHRMLREGDVMHDVRPAFTHEHPRQVQFARRAA